MKLCVCVPVRDERDRLPELLSALAVQRDAPPGSWTACLLFDGCTDGSEALARAFAETAPFPVAWARSGPGEAPSAGRARRAAMALGLQALGGEADGLLLTTDADSAPAPTWIAAMRTALAASDVAAGRITRRDGGRDAHQTRVERYYDRLYALRRRLDPLPWEPEPGRHCTGGANLGFRAGAYLALGGFEPRPTGEDALIVDAAERLGLRVRRDGRAVVETASRRDGRAPQGLASALRALDADGVASVVVAHPEDAAWRYAAQAAARAAFDRPEACARLAGRLRLGREQVAQVRAGSRNAHAFAACVVPDPPGGVRHVGLAVAERALDRMEAERQPACA